MTIDTRFCESFWQEVAVKAMKELLTKMENTNPVDDSDEALEAFENTPITIGFGDTVFIFPTLAQTYNFLAYGIKDFLEEMDY